MISLNGNYFVVLYIRLQVHRILKTQQARIHWNSLGIANVYSSSDQVVKNLHLAKLLIIAEISRKGLKSIEL